MSFSVMNKPPNLPDSELDAGPPSSDCGDHLQAATRWDTRSENLRELAKEKVSHFSTNTLIFTRD
jgi:hypothetical protein